MGVDDAVRALAAKAPNFGYLLQHEPALVVDPRIKITRGRLKPEHIGRPVSANTTHNGSNLVPDNQPLRRVRRLLGHDVRRCLTLCLGCRGESGAAQVLNANEAETTRGGRRSASSPDDRGGT